MRISTLLLLAGFAISGCESKSATNATTIAPNTAKDEAATERAKLSAEDLALVEAQEWCVVSNDERLGSMGPPLKLTIKDQTVFVCCTGCKKKAESNPDKTLAKLDELKAKAKSEKETKK